MGRRLGTNPVEARVRDCQLTVYGDYGKVLLERRVVIPPLPEQALLERFYREHVDGTPCRYAVAREGRVVRALYLAEDLVPDAAIKLLGRRGRPGRWVTTSLSLGGMGRAFMGPDVFFRQVDITATEVWLAKSLIGFGGDAEVRELSFGRERVFEWEMRTERFLYRTRAGRWWLYGAGCTQTERIDAVLAGHEGDAAEFLWEIGAMRLA